MYPRRVPGSEADACLWLLSTAAWGLFQRVVLGGGVRQLGVSHTAGDMQAGDRILAVG